ncbi:TPA: ead/Ea22-like family protein [Klebsiella quasipneumoniae subsp. quasipneumoniae]|nr:ead/Ea22-like family protein [Klebsiella pneumoniae]
MTDITELAQSLKSAAEKATPGPWEVQFGEEIYATDGVDNEQVAIATLDARDTDYIALANPANVLALVEALEKAQQRIASQREYYEGVIADGGKRIAELESRTVKLPKRHSMLLREDFNEDYHTEMAYKADEVHASLAAAGIKVEAE